MKIRLGGFPRRQMRVVRGLTCAVLLILAACVGGPTSAGIYTMPWDQQRGPNPVFARQVVAYPTHERPGTIIIDPASHFLYFIHDAGQAIRLWSGRRPGRLCLVRACDSPLIASRNGPTGTRPRKCWFASRSLDSTCGANAGRSWNEAGGPENPLTARAL